MNKMNKPAPGLFFKPIVLIITTLIFISACNNPMLHGLNQQLSQSPGPGGGGLAMLSTVHNISRELQEMAVGGIGGVEITSIYGVQGEEQRDIEYLSTEFSEILKFTVEEAKRLGMGVDIPPGSGWRCGGPFVPEEKGLWSLKMTSLKVKAGEIVDPARFENGEAFSFVDETGQVTYWMQE
jgi:hypothetical protein